MQTTKSIPSTLGASRIIPWVAGGLLASFVTLQAAAVSLSDSPVTVVRSTSVKPNIMLLMDTSTSMSFTHMPDEVEGDRTIMTVGYASSQCNSLYYSPTRTYEIPKKSDGSRLPTPGFTNAPYNYFIDFPAHAYTSATTGATVVNLSNSFQAWDRNTVKNSTPADTPKAAYYWVYTAADGSKPNLHYNASACRDSFPASNVTTFVADGGGRWNKFTVDTAEQQNFANWYTYYRTRMALIKSGVSIAFNAQDPVMDDRFRLGLISMNPYNVQADGSVISSPQPSVESSKYEPLRPFDATQRTLWFNKLFSQTPSGYSPAREGLARVGRHYAKETDAINTGMNYDDNTLFQYTCQQNFTIMTTDGYWNVQNETQGPLRLTKDGGGRIGQMDGTLTSREGYSPRPMWDGALSGTSAITDQDNHYRTVPCSGFFARTETVSQARITQYEQSSQQMTQRSEKWITGTRQQRATTERYTESTDRWFKTETQREQTSWQVLQSSVLYEQGSWYQRGGGSYQTQRRTTSDTRVTKQYKSTEVTSMRETYQWQLSTTQRTQEQFYFSGTKKQQLRLEYGQEQRTQQNWISEQQTLETSSTKKATFWQEWGTSWRYEVQISERYVAASAAMCTQYASTCRIRDVARDIVVASIPTVASAVPGGCVVDPSGPTAGNDWTTTSCESGKRYLNDSGVAVGSSPIQYSVDACTEGWSGRTYTKCDVSSITAQPVESCTVGTNTTTKKVTTACTPNIIKNKVPIATCTAPAASQANNWTTTTCGNNDVAFTPVSYGSCTPITTKTTPDFKLVSCQYRYYTTATASTTTTTAPLTTPVLNFAGYSGYAVNPGAACAAATNANRIVQCDSTSSLAVKTGRIAPNSGSASAGTSTCVDQAATASTTPAWTQTICATPAKTQVTPADFVASCTFAGNPDNIGASPNFLVTRCMTATTTNVPQTSDCTSQQNNGATYPYKSASCVRQQTANAAFNPADATCSTGSVADSNKNFYRCYNSNPVVAYSSTTVCTPILLPVASAWKTRACENTDTTETIAYQTCVAVTPGSGNNQLSVTCTQNNTGWVNGSCTPTANGVWPRIECQTIVIPGNQIDCSTTPDPALCVRTDTPYARIAACQFPPVAGELISNTPTANGSVRVYEHLVASTGVHWLCRVTTQNETPVESCNPGTTNFVTTNCRNTTSTTVKVDVDTCTAGNGSSPNWTHTSCRDVYATVSSVEQHDIPVANCTDGKSPDGLTRTSCRHEITTDVPVASCTNANAGVQTGTSPDFITKECKFTSTTAPAQSCTVTAGTSPDFVHVTACPVTTTGPNPINSCTNVAQNATGPDWIETTCVTESSAYPTRFLPVESCTGSGTMDANGITKRCRPNNAVMAPVQACSFGLGTTAATSPLWTTTTCQISALSTTDNSNNIVYKYVDGCTTQNATADNGWKTIECLRDTTSSIATSCTPQAGNDGNGWKHVDCSPVAGQQLQFQGFTKRVFNVLSGNEIASQTTTDLLVTNWANVGSCAAPNDLTYRQPPDGRPSPSQNPTPSQLLTQVPNAATVAPELASCTQWPCETPPPTTSTTGGSTGSLADVAQYYYVTDLRPNNVSTVDTIEPVNTDTEDDRATHQHMTTFGIGLGVSGNLTFRDDYKTASTGDFARIRAGTNGFNWPVWPAPVDSFSPAATLDANGNYSRVALYDDPRSIDDFWHAAVNGRGQYFSAGDPNKVIAGLGSAIKTIEASAGASSGATTSTLSPVLGDNTAFVASFTTKEWTGELAARAINITTGVVQSSSQWTAGTQLAARVGAACDDRTIYYYKPTGTNKRAMFAWNTKNCTLNQTITDGMESDTATKALFAENLSGGLMRQYVNQSEYNSTAAQRAAASNANLVNFLRGQTGFQGYIAGSQDATKVFRTRTSPLGTIVNSQPAYVKAPNREYADADYFKFRDDMKTRKSMVYVASNGGMLHGFDAATGVEDWAWVPTIAMSKMYRLGDSDYTANPNYLTDGTPIAGDIYDTSITTPAWKTIVVAGMNNGGRGYYAVDVTDAASPKGLWEFKGSSSCVSNPVGQTSDCDVGQTFGRPIITKLGNGQWVVMVTSGYNNTVGTEKGHLYILNAATGQIINKISTTGTGLKDINTYVSNVVSNNTALRVYGGDLTGNIWRFDVNDIYNPTGKEATLVGRATDSAGTAQPITTRVQLSEIGGKTMLFVGTGKLLHANDLDVTPPVQTQSVYGFVDSAIGGFSDGVNADVAYPPTDSTRTLRAVLKPLELTTQANGTRTIACTGTTAICASELGWRIDLPDTGERVNIDMSLALNTLVFSSNVPSTDQACDVGGRSWLNYVSATSGEAVNQVNGNSTVSVPLSNSLNVGLGVIILPSGQVIAIGRGAGGGIDSKPVETGTPGPVGRRVSWREITTQ